jgi:methionyl-tRNA formyltransferase
MMKRVVLLLNHKPGIEVCRFLVEDEMTEIVSVFLTGDDSAYESEIETILDNREIPIYRGKDVWDPATISEILKPLRTDFLISVYWPWLLKEFTLDLFKDSINFHPALLPKNRGWFPHVYNLKDDTPAGVALHRIFVDADAGDIWALRAVPTLPTDTASELYNRLQVEIVGLFKEVWPQILRDEIRPVEQDHSISTYNKKNAIAELDEIDLNSNVNVREFLNLLRSRTFNNRGFAYFFSEGKKISISISLSEINQD